ncbi:hypothetical protein RND81_07G101900 [Saponaria officinalis]|uniref:Uncharacterized protein n=1 Tax=Saponaria officinalis TaxID=3572 RepID=A0AAW1JNS2_SAPOF
MIRTRCIILLWIVPSFPFLSSSFSIRHENVLPLCQERITGRPTAITKLHTQSRNSMIKNQS